MSRSPKQRVTSPKKKVVISREDYSDESSSPKKKIIKASFERTSDPNVIATKVAKRKHGVEVKLETAEINSAIQRIAEIAFRSNKGRNPVTLKVEGRTVTISKENIIPFVAGLSNSLSRGIQDKRFGDLKVKGKRKSVKRVYLLKDNAPALLSDIVKKSEYAFEYGGKYYTTDSGIFKILKEVIEHAKDGRIEGTDIYKLSKDEDLGKTVFVSEIGKKVKDKEVTYILEDDESYYISLPPTIKSHLRNYFSVVSEKSFPEDIEFLRKISAIPRAGPKGGKKKSEMRKTLFNKFVSTFFVPEFSKDNLITMLVRKSTDTKYGALYWTTSGKVRALGTVSKYITSKKNRTKDASYYKGLSDVKKSISDLSKSFNITRETVEGTKDLPKMDELVEFNETANALYDDLVRYIDGDAEKALADAFSVSNAIDENVDLDTVSGVMKTYMSTQEFRAPLFELSRIKDYAPSSYEIASELIISGEESKSKDEPDL